MGRTGFGWFLLVPLFSSYPVILYFASGIAFVDDTADLIARL